MSSMEEQQVMMVDLVGEYHEIKDEIDEAVHRVVESGHFILGEEVEAFEHEVARYLGVRHTIGVASGSDALLLALMALDIGPGDKVITTPFSFFATASAVVRLGATPVFCDIDPRTFDLDPGSVRRYLEASYTPAVKALIPVHLYGQCCDMDPLLELARTYNLKVVEDCAQSFGSTYKGHQSGGIGDIGCFSFFPTKNLGAYGDGGMVTTNDDDLAEHVRMLRVHGARRKYHHEELGINSRLDAMQAAILRVKLKHVDQWTERKRVLAAAYDKELSTLDWLQVPYVMPECRHTYHQCTIKVPAERRATIQEALAQAGIQTQVYYPEPLHRQPCFSDKQELPEEPLNVDAVVPSVLSLPMSHSLSLSATNAVGEVLCSFSCQQPLCTSNGCLHSASTAPLG
ncbi:DegT/DnrJ/EryC1/StrS family aminotransferase [Candidatus Cryosericum hinesii]|jgi:dTDP-4-amino-4,6-dideoxygalactose transaminase|nr:DegT/DnrJ/EryC1/StrS family aminotransferase [Candidatus Cryosericum hinesii]